MVEFLPIYTSVDIRYLVKVQSFDRLYYYNLKHITKFTVKQRRVYIYTCEPFFKTNIYLDIF